MVHLQWELFLYGGPPSLPGLVPALVSLRKDRAAPLVTTMHQVIEPSEIDQAYTRLHRVAAAAVVARPRSGRRAVVHLPCEARVVREEPFRHATLSLVAAAASAQAAGRNDVSDALLDAATALDRHHPTYYGAAWVALARLWLDTPRLGGCRRPAISGSG